MEWYDDLSDFEECDDIRRMRRERFRLQQQQKETVCRKRKKSFHVVRRSSVKRDPRFKSLPLGDGVFATVDGNHVIKFEGGVTTLVTQMTKLQTRYAVESGFDEDYVIVPPHDDIVRGSIHFSWKINHSVANPTHELCWCDEIGNEHAYLRPFKSIKKNKEFTFRYF